ncbi:glycosyltransferase [Streptomyces sp. JB150]|uniref:glycosyltransferase n=1 Tax=Streptomyces sp. JB150 TaxID=2714844 RepID=UPI00140E81BE|nr:glycosyltransferase [Streptomyces sp. JB150]QIJ62738.1 glycosyltransferase family 4 protein [Streptomyces sp. JB150]
MHQSAPDPWPRVLHLTQPVDGGVARVVADLAAAQLAAGMRVTVGCPESRFADRLRSAGVDVRTWRATRAPGPSLVGEVRRLARLVAEVRPDLVHAHSAKAGLAGRLAVRGRIPTVFQPHAWSFEAVGGVTGALALRWERHGARWAHRTVCVSEAERETGLRAGIDGRWSVIPNGVDPHRFRPAPDPFSALDCESSSGPRSGPGHGARSDAGAVRAALLPGTGPRVPLVVCVGRLCRQKGQDVLLDAWGAVRARVPDARLVLVGDGPDRDRLKPPASVRLVGAVADVVPWYQAADLVVLPSRWEGMALAPLEAMACGRPVVVTDVDGARESLPLALRPHCLVPAGDPAALAAAVVRLLLDPPLRASLGRRARRHIQSAHDARHTAAAVADLYRDLLGRGPGARVVPTEYRESIHS